MPAKISITRCKFVPARKIPQRRGTLNEDTMEYALGFDRGYVPFTPGARNAYLVLTANVIHTLHLNA